MNKYIYFTSLSHIRFSPLFVSYPLKSLFYSFLISFSLPPLASLFQYDCLSFRLPCLQIADSSISTINFSLPPFPSFYSSFLKSIFLILFNYFSFQVICDATYRIRNIVAKWPGSVNDSRIFRTSSIGQRMLAGNLLNLY